MGEAKRRRETIKDRLAGFPFCIYCGGITAATTIDHMPPIALFKGRQRPKGMEFPSCHECNQGTKHSDMVASLISRASPTTGPEDGADAKRLFAGIRNNVPGLLEEMRIGAGGQKLARNRLGRDWRNFSGGFMRVDGPLVSQHMWLFAAKMGLALHFECTGKPIPCSGAIRPIWYTNYQRLSGEFPQELFGGLPHSLTLRQGRKSVTDQFECSFRVAPDGTIGIYMAAFRFAFAVACIAVSDASLLERDPNDGWPVVCPPIFRSFEGALAMPSKGSPDGAAA